MTRSVAALLVLAACAAPDAPVPGAGPAAPGDSGAPAPAVTYTPLDDARLARRASIDLRGALPSIAELDALEAGSSVSDLRDAFLDDPRFEERMVGLLGQAWRTQVDEFLVEYKEYAAYSETPSAEYPFERGIGEEPLRLAARVAASDLPWSTVVTADWSMANEITGPVWPTDYPTGATGWQQVRYTDARPAVGILATNGLWWRYFSTPSNYNRGRVAAIARLLLCEDYVSRAVTLTGSASVTDAADVEDNLRTNPYCLGCHSSIDPAATALFGFWVASEYSVEELDTYHPEREPLGPELLGVTPSWFGTPFTSLADLGPMIGADPRFASCAVETAASLLWRRAPSPEDYEELATARAAYIADPRMKAVLRAITDGERYRAGGVTAATDEARDREQVVRSLDAPLLASVLEDLTAYTWEYEGFDQLRNDTWGYRVLGGGVDGFYQTRSQSRPGLTWLLVTQRAAESAAAFAVDNELVYVSGRHAFAAVTLADLPGDPAFDAELVSLHRRLYGDRPDDTWLADITALWTATADEADPAEAWRTTLAALLQDPRFGSS